MCGIIGVINSTEAAEEIFLGLQNLQHRGQDGGGIVTLQENTVFHRHRGAGLLEIAFPPENFKKLQGSLGIGHTRYATVGKKEVALLQPFVLDEVGLAIAHNGNLLNFHCIKSEIELDDSNALKTGCDSELILWLLADNLKRFGTSTEGLFNSIKSIAGHLIGSYSVIGILKGIGLFAFRDSSGLRPLMMGYRANADGKNVFAFASESTSLEFLGYTLCGDVAPGEAIVVTLDGQVIRHQYAPPTPRHCMFEWVYFARVESKIDDLSVYQARFNLGVELALEIKRQSIQPDIVVPVPETSRIAAIALAESIQVPFREILIKNRYVNRTFILESQAAREEAIRRKLYPVASEIAGKKVLIVDDSIVRGNTAIKIIELLRKSGAQEIYLASTCPPIRYPCYYGIDFPDRSELLAGKHPEDMLPEILGVDKLIYQSLEGLRSALKIRSLCLACLTGDYPTDVTNGAEFSEQRVLEREIIAQ